MMASKKTKKLTGEQLEYQKIIWRVICQGACSPGVEHMRKYDDFATMFYAIPNPAWVYWLIDNMGCPRPSEAAEKNACMNIGRDMRPSFARCIDASTLRRYDDLVEGPWYPQNTPLLYGRVLSLGWHVANANLHSAMLTLRDAALFGAYGYEKASAREALREALLNFDVEGFEQAIIRRRFSPYSVWSPWQWKDGVGVVEVR